MTTAHTIILSIFILAMGSVQASAQPRLPYYDWGAGPCEYCLYGDWTADRETPLFRTRNPRSRVVFRAKKGEKLTAITGVVITAVAGLGKAMEPTTMAKFNRATEKTSWVDVDRGKTFHILTYHGEGNYSVWYQGQLLAAGLEGRPLKIIRAPQFVWWVKIRNNKGQIGWTKQVKNFSGPHEV